MSFVDRVLGPVAPELGWVPAPRYLMRRTRIRSLMCDISPGRLLEVGPGAGALLVEFARQGFCCAALEASDEARHLAGQFIASFNADIPVHAVARPDWTHGFDLVCAFDVLEHIERDDEALRQWASWLKPGGFMLLSVPAHKSLWTAGDEWAGHFRRYEKDELLELFRRSGLIVEVCECYGFPLANLSERLSAPVYARRIRGGSSNENFDRQRNNDRSGVDRGPHLSLFPLLRSWPGKLLLSFFGGIQHVFSGTDLGSGYIVRARMP